MSLPPPHAVDATYRGQVQGVGFRYTVERLAQDHPYVTGYVKNMADGTVFLHLEGARADIEALLRAIAHGALERYIRGVEVRAVTPSGRYRDFRIAF